MKVEKKKMKRFQSSSDVWLDNSLSNRLAQKANLLNNDESENTNSPGLKPKLPMKSLGSGISPVKKMQSQINLNYNIK